MNNKNTKFLSNKKILITSYSYASFGGAELNAVELADQLIEFGATPYFFSYDVDGPLAKWIKERFQTDIITDNVYHLAEDESVEELRNTQLNISDYDYIWVGANTIPISIIKQINSAKKIPKFIFIHMSPLIAFPLDTPLFPKLEKEIASRILSISDKASDIIQRTLGRKTAISEWCNPTPKNFRLLQKREGQLKKIAVISSSHPSSEIIEGVDLLKRKGIQVEHIGKYNNNMQVVDASFYDKYDLIVGIGKNAKYSLVSGVPVYVYGRFGGDGYLNSNNIATNKEHNFSGRGFDKKPSGDIAQEIIEGYQDALKFQEEHRSDFINEYSIDVVARRLFSDLEKETSKEVEFSQKYINWLVSMQIMIIQKVRTQAAVQRLEAALSQVNEQLSKCESELGAIQDSKSWKVTKPLRRLNNKLWRPGDNV